MPTVLDFGHRDGEDSLVRQQRFSLDTQSSIDVVLPSGQKIQCDHPVKVSVEPA